MPSRWRKSKVAVSRSRTARSMWSSRMALIGWPPLGGAGLVLGVAERDRGAAVEHARVGARGDAGAGWQDRVHLAHVGAVAHAVLEALERLADAEGVPPAQGDRPVG